MVFKSHPDKILIEHLREVSELSKINNPEEKLKYISYVVGALHDFGKYTSFFQNHLSGGEGGLKSHHSFISALFTYYVLRQKYKDGFLPLTGFVAVVSHHTSLPNVNKFGELVKLCNGFSNTNQLVNLHEEVSVLQEQISDVLKNRAIIEKELTSLNIGLKTDISEFYDKINSIICSIAKDAHRRVRMRDTDYTDLYLIFSSLIDADKRSAGNVSSRTRYEIPADIVDRYREKKFSNVPKNRMNVIRDALYNDVISKISVISPSTDKIFSITAPTGSAKTLASLSFALKLRKKIEEEKGYIPRIIYSLPFISIIRQNFSVFENILLSELGEEYKNNKSAYLIAHHHVAPVKFTENSEEKSLGESLMYIESWDSEIIVTTFVQLLHSIIASKNSFLKKYHNIYGSIVILDEVQNIPAEYWKLVGNILTLLTEKLNCTVVLMTATKPLIFDKTFELAEHADEFFEEMNRMRFCVDTVKRKEEEVFGDILSKMKEEKSYLAVFNTIKSSGNFYKFVKENAPFDIMPYSECSDINTDGKRMLFYLSSQITPYQRKIRVEKIENALKSGLKPILVSTQVVEAGVDVDFDVVFRDIAPLDSIVQVAGRCNREWKIGKGTGYVFRIDSLASYVYKKILPNITLDLLKGKTELEEPEFSELINEFFKNVKERAVGTESDEFLEALEKLDFEKVGKFKVIDEDQKQSVFVAVNDEAEAFITEFIKDISAAKDSLDRRKIYLANKQRLNLFTVNVRKDNLPALENGFYIVHHDQLDEYYDMETGYIDKVKNAIW